MHLFQRRLAKAVLLYTKLHFSYTQHRVIKFETDAMHVRHSILFSRQANTEDNDCTDSAGITKVALSPKHSIS
jgi:hypothetical protein